MSETPRPRRRRGPPGIPWMTRGARYSVVFLTLLTFLLAGTAYHLSVSAVQGSIASRATVIQLCQAGNEFRAQQVTLWTHLVAISAPPPHQTPAQRRARQAFISAFLAYVRQVFAPRNCSARYGGA